jgi:hypothetical protein
LVRVHTEIIAARSDPLEPHPLAGRLPQTCIGCGSMTWVVTHLMAVPRISGTQVRDGDETLRRIRRPTKTGQIPREESKKLA